MAGGYKAVPEGVDALVAEFRSLRKQLSDVNRRVTALGLSIDPDGNLIFGSTDHDLIVKGGSSIEVNDDGDITLAGGEISINPDGTSVTLGTFTETIDDVDYQHAAVRFADPGYDTDTASIGLVPIGSGLPPMLWIHAPDTSDGLSAEMRLEFGLVLLDAGTAVRVTAPYLSLSTGVGGAAWTTNSSGSEWQAKDHFAVTFVPVRASSFPTSSSRDVKEHIEPVPFDTLAAIKEAPATRWRYKPDHATEDLTHIGPMAEDLPAEMVHDAAGVKSVDLLSLVGVLWDAVGKLSARLAAIE